jgi:single-strand DNA-binding protein
LEYTTSGKAYLKNALAIDRRGEGTDFVNIIAWEKTAEFIDKYFHKGNKIGIVGRLQSSSYKKDNKTFYSLDVVVEGVTFCESKTTEDTLLPSNKSDNNFLQVDESIELPFE